MIEFKNDLDFDYTMYSFASIKFFLDCLHHIPAGPTDLATLIECIDFCQFEGKTTYNSFELDLVKGLMDSVMKAELSLGTELLISAYFTRVDNFDDRFQQKVIEKITKEAVAVSIYELDMDNKLNQKLIEMGVQKGVFADTSEQSVVLSLMKYGRKLELSPVIPDPELVRYFAEVIPYNFNQRTLVSLVFN